MSTHAPTRLGRDFWLLLAAQSTSAIGDRIAPIALTFAVLDLTGSVGDVGLVLAASTLALVVFLLAGGVWADRLPRRQVILGADVVRFGMQAACAALLLTGTADVWQLVALQAGYGAAQAFFQPAATGLLPQIVPTDALQRANALLSTARNVSYVAGPALAGLLLALTRPAWGLAADAATFALSATCVAAMRSAPHIAAATETAWLREMRLGWQAFRARTWLWASVTYSAFFVGFVLVPFQILGPLTAKEALGGPAVWGMIATASGAGSVLGGLVALHLAPRRPLRTAYPLLALFWVPQLVLLAARAPVALIAGAAVAGGAALTFFAVVWETALQRNVPHDTLSRVSAYDWFGSMAFQPLGQAIVVPLAVAAGVATTLYAGAAWAVVSTAAVMAVRDVRALETDDPDP